jgi:P-type Ca2+ transporter type 2C
MAVTWGLVILIGAVVTTYFRFQNCKSLYKLSIVSGEVQAARNGKQVTVPQRDIVPGDLIHIQPGRVFCDMVVICADTLVVDESDLTGEATPMAKTSIDSIHNGDEIYNRTTHKRHTVLAGTTVMEAEDALAIVIATSSYSTRGVLIREIFSYRRGIFKFDVEIPMIMTILFMYAIFGFSMVIYFIQDSLVYAWFYGM